MYNNRIRRQRSVPERLANLAGRGLNASAARDSFATRVQSGELPPEVDDNGRTHNRAKLTIANYNLQPGVTKLKSNGIWVGEWDLKESRGGEVMKMQDGRYLHRMPGDETGRRYQVIASKYINPHPIGNGLYQGFELTERGRAHVARVAGPSQPVAPPSRPVAGPSQPGGSSQRQVVQGRPDRQAEVNEQEMRWRAWDASRLTQSLAREAAAAQEQQQIAAHESGSSEEASSPPPGLPTDPRTVQQNQQALQGIISRANIGSYGVPGHDRTRG